MSKAIKDFKAEFRMICTDTWYDAKDAWFEATGQMHKRGIKIPSEWEYSPGKNFPDGSPADGTCPTSYFYEIFGNLSDEEITEVGNFLFRYCQFLESNGCRPE